MTTKVKVGDIINIKGEPHWDGSLVTEILGVGPFPVCFTHPTEGEGAETLEGVTVVSRAVDKTKEGWTLASLDYTPQDNHEVSYCMGVATHWREVKTLVKRVQVFDLWGLLSVDEWTHQDSQIYNNATATLNGKTWTIELD